MEGKKFCDQASKETGVPTDILFCDYRDIPAEMKFDKIASIEMAEHVGIANFVDPYLSSVRRLMKRPDSSFLLQVSGLRQGANWQDVAWGLFMSKYIFPGADASTPLNWYVNALGAWPCFEHVHVDEAVGGAGSSECAVSCCSRARASMVAMKSGGGCLQGCLSPGRFFCFRALSLGFSDERIHAAGN